MPGPWALVADVKQAVADGLKKDVADLKDYWVRIITRCVERGYADIKNYLIGRGYTMAQLDQWDDRVTYTFDQALFFCYVEGGGPEDQSERDIKRLDRLAWLLKEKDGIAISIGGVMTPPGAPDPAAGMGCGSLPLTNSGVDYGPTFGLKCNRRNGVNQFGDELPDMGQSGYDLPPNW